jgi:hypothetical protein
MFGSVATWNIHTPFAMPSDQEAFVRDLVRRGIAEARALGTMDVFMGALAPDLLAIVSLYETNDDAVAAAEWAQRFVEREYRDVVDVIDRPVGPAFELRQFINVDPSDFPGITEDPAPMIANFVTWRLDPVLQTTDRLAPFLSRVWHDSFPALRAVGLCDIVCVQIHPDELLALRLFVPRANELPLFSAAIAEAEERFSHFGMVESVRTGLGWDSQLLLDYLQ